MQNTSTSNMRAFYTVWLGQIVSALGSRLSAFALSVWVFQQTGSAIQYALILLCVIVPAILISPFAGVLADRLDRRLVMIASNSGAALSTLLLALLIFTGTMQLWHIYLSMAVVSIFTAFRVPAYQATVPMLVPKERLGHVNGLVQLGPAVAQLIAPALAGILVVAARIEWVLLIDVATFLVGIVSLLVVHIPRPKKMPDATAQPSLWREAWQGWSYISARGGLLALMLFLVVVNALVAFVSTLSVPLLLSLTGPQVMGAVVSIAGSGMVVGSLVMGAWGGTRRRIMTVFAFQALYGLSLMLIGLRPWLWLVAIGAFGIMFCFPIISGASETIWQTKVAPDMLGRAFAVRRMLLMSAEPFSYLLAGALADRIFEPLFQPGGTLAGSFLGAIVGVGPGRGIGFLFVLLGLLMLLITAFGYLSPRLRYMEEELPDTLPATQPAQADMRQAHAEQLTELRQP